MGYDLSLAGIQGKFCAYDYVSPGGTVSVNAVTTQDLNDQNMDKRLLEGIRSRRKSVKSGLVVVIDALSILLLHGFHVARIMQLIKGIEEVAAQIIIRINRDLDPSNALVRWALHRADMAFICRTLSSGISPQAHGDIIAIHEGRVDCCSLFRTTEASLLLQRKANAVLLPLDALWTGGV
jgi:hypothetical protein